MYTVLLDGQILFDPRVDELKIYNPKLSFEVNNTFSFDFTIYSNHPLYAQIKRFKSVVEVFQGNTRLFRGRVLNEEIGFLNEKKIICEGDLAFFNDSIIRPYEYAGDIIGFLQFVIDEHNKQVDPDKRFTIGEVTVTNSTNYITRSSINPAKSWDVLMDKLVKLLGGFIVLRREGDVNYIDYLADSKYRSLQEIELGKNLLDLTRRIKGENIITALIPYGARLKDEEGEETDERVTIEAVNGGVDYVFDQEAVDLYGWVFGTETWDDVTIDTNLLRKAKEVLAQRINMDVAIELTAVDLSMMDASIDEFRIFEYVKVNSPSHMLEDFMLVSKLSIDLLNPQNNTLTLGLDYATFTERQLETEQAIKNVSVIKGPKGERGPEGPRGIQGPNGSDGQSQYVHLRYSANANGSGFTGTPNNNTKYIGIAVTNSQTAPTPYTSYTWSKYVGENGSQGIQGPKGVDGQTTYTWVKYADTITGQGLDDSPEGKRFIGLAFNKLTQTESTNASDYQWSEMPQNIAIGGRNLLPAFTSDKWEKTISVEPYRFTPGTNSNDNTRIELELIRGSEYTLTFNTDHMRVYVSSRDEFGELTRFVAGQGNGIYTFTVPNDSEYVTISSDTFSGNIGLERSIWNLKLEKGNIATDWTPAPEDVQASIDEKADLDYVTDIQTELNTSIETEAGTIRTEIEREYTAKTELEEYKETVSTQFENNYNSFNFTFQELIQQIETVDEETRVQFEELVRYIRFEGGNIVLGEVGNEITLQIQHDRISFLQSGAEVAYFSNNKLYILDVEILNSLQIGAFAYLPRTNGSLDFKRVIN